MRSCGCSGTGGWSRVSSSSAPVLGTRDRDQDGPSLQQRLFTPSTGTDRPLPAAASALGCRHRDLPVSFSAGTGIVSSSPVQGPLLPLHRG